MTSIFEGQPPKTRSFPTKTRVIWVPGISKIEQQPQKRRYNKKNLGSEQKSLWFLLESHHLQRLASVNQDKCDTYPDYSDMYPDVKTKQGDINKNDPFPL